MTKKVKAVVKKSAAWQFSPLLASHVGNDPPITALVVGAGAVVNAWKPVIRALQKRWPTEIKNEDAANCILARIVYLLRYWSRTDEKYSLGELKRHLEFCAEIKAEIAREIGLAESSGELHVRDEFKNIVEWFIFRSSRKFLVFNANWDSVVDSAMYSLLESKNAHFKSSLVVHHIHGNVNDSSKLYLPTEINKETYRTQEDELKIGTMHSTLMSSLETAHRVVVYGLSMSPLDAELTQAMAAGWDNPVLESIHVVCPNHEEVANRINVLLRPKNKVKILGYSPTELSKSSNWTAEKR
jgi:hypothetical protein